LDASCSSIFQLAREIGRSWASLRESEFLSLGLARASDARENSSNFRMLAGRTDDGQSLLQIGDKVICIFDSHRQPD
jgi:hypothetical protein